MYMNSRSRFPVIFISLSFLDPKSFFFTCTPRQEWMAFFLHFSLLHCPKPTLAGHCRTVIDILEFISSQNWDILSFFASTHCKDRMINVDLNLSSYNFPFLSNTRNGSARNFWKHLWIRILGYFELSMVTSEIHPTHFRPMKAIPPKSHPDLFLGGSSLNVPFLKPI